MGFRLFRSLAALFSDRIKDEGRERQKRVGDLSFGYAEGQGTIYKAVRPDRPGRVQVRGSSWPACCEQPIELLPGDIVDIVGQRELMLIVEPAFLLKASLQGQEQIEQAVSCQNGGQPDPDWFLPALRNGTGLEFTDELLRDNWRRFRQRKPINREVFKAFCQGLGLDWQVVIYRSGMVSDAQSVEPSAGLPGRLRRSHSQPSVANGMVLDFVGREGAIADLIQLDRSGVKLVVIQGQGGVGKTTLARQYFQQQSFERVLECWMAHETEDIASAESVVQEWLRQHFDQEPAQEFGICLERLRTALRRQRVGVLLDNLEPALDRDGRLISSQRGYVELLRVLADPTVQSLTLISSREPLHEASVTICPYELPGLDESTWRRVLSQQQIRVHAASLSAMHAAYAGNAKAMLILGSAIRLDFGGDLQAYWQECETDLLSSRDLANLVTSHFKRLQQLYPEAHRLLCRLGCYRYQDLPTVPLAGLVALLWDVPSEQHRHIVRFLRALCLLEMNQGEYRLHAVIRAKAIALLQTSQDWDVANRHAATFWTESVTTVSTVEQALGAMEAYHHYRQIGDLEQAGLVLLTPRDNPWQKNEPLGVAFYRLGLLQRMKDAIAAIIDRISPSYALSKLQNILGDLYWLSGQLGEALACHQQSRHVAIELGFKDLELVSLFNMGLCQIDLWELERAAQLFQSAIDQAENTQFHHYAVGSCFCLAFLHSCRGERQSAFDRAKQVRNEYTVLSSSVWSRGYSLLFLGMTYQNLEDSTAAQKLYDLAQSYADESCYTQVKARALNGLAAIARESGNGPRAIAQHLAAKTILETIGAKCDLAEVYYQLGLTYERLNQLQESHAALQQAIQLFQQIGAPKQIEKVQRIVNRMA